MTLLTTRIAIVATIGFSAGMAATFGLSDLTSKAATTTPEAVVSGYADIAYAGYSDSLSEAKALQAAIADLLDAPTEETLAAAKDAWLAARVPYQQTEVFRFGNVLVDDWEGKVNAWPLDEGLIDYVDGASGYGLGSDNPAVAANVIANTSIDVGGDTVDTSAITKELMAETLHELAGSEANVATGYHAIEFLLWGQDLNGNGPGAGARPATDFSLDACTGGHCDRRRTYLDVATDLLIDDLEDMVGLWAEGGEARLSVTQDASSGILAMVTGMGSLSYGELAGERMKLGLLLGDPEEEHDCFADNTHNSHFYNAQGISNVYGGHYKRVDGTVLSVLSLSALVAEADASADQTLRAAVDTTLDKMSAMVAKAEGGEAYDQMIAPGNTSGNATVQAAIDALVDQTKALEAAHAALGMTTVEFEGSDSLDNPSSVFE